MGGPHRVKMPVDSSGSVVISINVSHDCTHVLYAQLIQTGSALLLLQVYNMLGFTLYKVHPLVNFFLYFLVDSWWRVCYELAYLI